MVTDLRLPPEEVVRIHEDDDARLVPGCTVAVQGRTVWRRRRPWDRLERLGTLLNIDHVLGYQPARKREMFGRVIQTILTVDLGPGKASTGHKASA